ncbi:MAG: hypothetical protein D6730_20135 [Bacteroidetes bacterium]|nr:MAG: hypothetical protein D6730_20135 [Bacteroidota bacterium]
MKYFIYLLVLMVVSGASTTEVHAQASPRPGQPPSDILAQLAAISPGYPKVFRFRRGRYRLPAGGHFQGIQSDTSGRFLTLSASSDSVAYCIEADLNRGKLVGVSMLGGAPLRHAGGIQRWGHYLAVGIEDNHLRTRSEVLICKTGSGTGGWLQPVHRIRRTGEYERATAGAVALAAVSDTFVLVVGSWHSASLDVYLSNGVAPEDPHCRFSLRTSWKLGQARRDAWSDTAYASYQNLNLLPGADGRLWLVGFAREEGRHLMDVFELRLQAGLAESERLVKVMRREFVPRRSDFSAGAGLHLRPDGSLGVWSCHHHKGIVEYFGSSQ